MYILEITMNIIQKTRDTVCAIISGLINSMCNSEVSFIFDHGNIFPIDIFYMYKATRFDFSKESGYQFPLTLDFQFYFSIVKIPNISGKSQTSSRIVRSVSEADTLHISGYDHVSSYYHIFISTVQRSHSLNIEHVTEIPVIISLNITYIFIVVYIIFFTPR